MFHWLHYEMVGVAGFEPAACSTQNYRATRLRHTPYFLLLHYHRLTCSEQSIKLLIIVNTLSITFIKQADAFCQKVFNETLHELAYLPALSQALLLFLRLTPTPHAQVGLMKLPALNAVPCCFLSGGFYRLRR